MSIDPCLWHQQLIGYTRELETGVKSFSNNLTLSKAETWSHNTETLFLVTDLLLCAALCSIQILLHGWNWRLMTTIWTKCYVYNKEEKWKTILL